MRMSEKQNPARILYQCVRCGNEITSDQFTIMLGIKCPNCGFRVLKKIRSPVVKKIKAR